MPPVTSLQLKAVGVRPIPVARGGTAGTGSRAAGELRAIGNELRLQALILFGLVGIMWAAELVDLAFLRGALDGLGIRPRTLDGLRGIFFAPFLHGGLAHLIANTVPFLGLGWLILLRGVRVFLLVTVVTVVLGGLAVWVIGGPNTVHIGASGLVFGYLGFLLLRGYFDRGVVSIIIALVVMVVYGGALWGVLPLRAGISWESHLFGFLAGALAARLVAPGRSSTRHAR